MEGQGRGRARAVAEYSTEEIPRSTVPRPPRCWCETNDKEKTQSIKDAEARIADLTTKIEELTANSARLNTETS